MAKAVKPKRPRKPRLAVAKVKKARKPRKKKVYKKEDITTSKIETVFMEWLTRELKLPIEDQYQIAKKWFDFKVKSTKILIEFDGDYWHCNPAIYKDGPTNRMQKKSMLNDKRKSTLALANGYTLIRVWESDFKKKPEEVKTRILKIVQDYFLKEANEPSK